MLNSEERGPFQRQPPVHIEYIESLNCTHFKLSDYFYLKPKIWPRYDLINNNKNQNKSLLLWKTGQVKHICSENKFL